MKRRREAAAFGRGAPRRAGGRLAAWRGVVLCVGRCRVAESRLLTLFAHECCMCVGGWSRLLPLFAHECLARAQQPRSDPGAAVGAADGEVAQVGREARGVQQEERRHLLEEEGPRSRAALEERTIDAAPPGASELPRVRVGGGPDEPYASRQLRRGHWHRGWAPLSTSCGHDVLDEVVQHSSIVV